MRYEIEIRKRAEKEELEDYKDLRALRSAKADPKNQQGRAMAAVAKELGLKRKKLKSYLFRTTTAKTDCTQSGFLLKSF